MDFQAQNLDQIPQLFEFGDKYRGKYDESLGDAEKKYCASVSNYKDELIWTALWLYKATDNADYLHYVHDTAHSFGGIGWSITEFSWDIKFAGLQILASQKEQSDLYTGDGSVDLQRNPVLKSKTGTWRARLSILGNECAKSLAYYGIATNLVIYLTSKLHEGNVTAAM